MEICGSAMPEMATSGESTRRERSRNFQAVSPTDSSLKVSPLPPIRYGRSNSRPARTRRRIWLESRRTERRHAYGSRLRLRRTDRLRPIATTIFGLRPGASSARSSWSNEPPAVSSTRSTQASSPVENLVAPMSRRNAFLYACEALLGLRRSNIAARMDLRTSWPRCTVMASSSIVCRAARVR